MTVRTLIVCALLPFGACFANPTPHPAGEDTVLAGDVAVDGAAEVGQTTDTAPSPPDNRADCQSEGGFWNDADDFCDLAGFADVTDGADTAADAQEDTGPNPDAGDAGDADDAGGGDDAKGDAYDETWDGNGAD